jgi:hypothetical protein
MLRTFKLLSPLMLIGVVAAGNVPAAHHSTTGEIGFPANYREWVFLSSGLDMNYFAGAPVATEHSFDNVFVDPVSWRAFKATGHWPQGTIFAKEGRHGATGGSINHSGQFQSGEPEYLELHVRDTRFPSGWGFFEVEGDKPAKVLPTSAHCYSCHQQHAAVETTFVQFYPTAKPIAIKGGTFDASK